MGFEPTTVMYTIDAYMYMLVGRRGSRDTYNKTFKLQYRNLLLIAINCVFQPCLHMYYTHVLYIHKQYIHIYSAGPDTGVCTFIHMYCILVYMYVHKHIYVHIYSISTYQH